MPLIERPHWSYSAINQYLRCPLQFYFERIRQLPVETVGSGLVLGSAVHRGLEAYHRSLQDGRPVPADHVKNIFQATWQFREQQQEIQYRSGENRQKAIDQGIALLETYLREPPPENIVAVEQSIIVPLRNSRGEYTETPLVAVIDLLTDHEEGLKVTEFKTSARAYSEAETRLSLQPTCYLAAIRETYASPVDFQFTVLVKTKTPKVQHIEVMRSPDELSRLGDLVETLERAIAAGCFYPNESPMNCSTCPHRAACLEWGRKAPAEIIDIDQPKEEVATC